MKYEELIILLPCHSLEDFPLYHEGENADGLLAGWTALWHPALVAAAGRAPTWHRVDDPPQQLANRLLVVPAPAASQLPTGFVQRAKESGAVVVRGKARRQEIVDAALAGLDAPPAVAPELAADFLALGYAFLQVQLLTRQMRYASNLDEIHFYAQLVAGATAAVAGDETTARDKLHSCFDLLAQERDHYYSVDAYVLDLTLVAPTTIGASLRDALAGPTPINLLLSGEVLEKIAAHEPDTLAALRRGLDENRVGLIGGEFAERRGSLLSAETCLGELRRGQAAFERHLGRRVEVFGRRRFGLGPLLPQVLHKLGFQGALHATLDDGSFPEGSQMRIRWQGADGTAIESLAKAPLDASKPESFLGFPRKLGESMDHDHVATLCLAHWPGQVSPWYDELRRASRFGAALGRFVTVDTYFRDTALSSHTERFEPDQYKSPYLKQAIIQKHTDPLSTSVRYWQRRVQATTQQALATLTGLVSGDAAAAGADWLARVDRDAETPDVADPDSPLDGPLAESVRQSTERFAATLPGQAVAPRGGMLVVNPCSYVRRIGVDVSPLPGLPAVEAPVYAAAESAAGKFAVVDVPPMGFAWLEPAPAAAARKPKGKPAPPMAEDNLLRNEFFQVLINRETGTLQSLHEYGARGNRLSQQLALRRPGPKPQPGDAMQDDDGAVYSVMGCDSFTVTHATTTLGEIVTTGRLMERDGSTLATFRQTYRLWRGSRILWVDVELDVSEEPRADPWNSYYCARFAWASELAELYRGVNETRTLTTAKRFEAPLYIDIDDGDKHTTILTGGLPYHRIAGHRMLDSLLLVRGERARRFRLGVGVDLAQPLHGALELLAPATATFRTAAPPKPASSSWLFHVNAKNVVATHWEPLLADGRVAGFRVRLLETQGRAAPVKLAAFRPVASARQVDFRGQSLADCKLDQGAVRVEMAAHEWVEIEARW